MLKSLLRKNMRTKIAANQNPGGKQTLLACAIAAALLPTGALALDLANNPPQAIQGIVTPNVIVTLDNGYIMEDYLSANSRQRRIDLLKEVMRNTFGDPSVVPNGRIRLAWQSSNNEDVTRRGRIDIPHYEPLATLTQKISKGEDISYAHNAMRVLDSEHRQNFMDYVNRDLITDGYYATRLYKPFRDADSYLRNQTLNSSSPWAAHAGTKNAGAPYLGCRRNFQIIVAGKLVSTSRLDYGGDFDGYDQEFPDGTQFNTKDPNTFVYRDRSIYGITSLADLALKSWAVEFKIPGLIGAPKPTTEYTKAPPEETFKVRDDPSATTTNQPGYSGGTDQSGSSSSVSKLLIKNQVTLPKYWNPRYDPATWPHMVTYTIGLGDYAIPKNNLVKQPGVERLQKIPMVQPSTMVPYGYDGDFAKYANGVYSWRAVDKQVVMSKDGKHVDSEYPIGEPTQDLWHAAINGRGRFFAVTQKDQLRQAFDFFLQDIYRQTAAGTGSRAASGSNATHNRIGIFTSHYDSSKNWKGWVSAKTFDAGLNLVPAWGGKTTAELLDATNPNSRLILTWSDQEVDSSGQKVPAIRPPGLATKERGGVSFTWESDDRTLSYAQRSSLEFASSGQSDGKGALRLQYIRGDRSQEGKGFRPRQSAQGSIINSDLWYLGAPVSGYGLPGYKKFADDNTSRLPMLYVGGDDGMLHGFSALDGSEKIAYVPRGVIGDLKLLTEPSFDDNHRYFVDGSPMTGDVDIGYKTGAPQQHDWRTFLVGTLGAGGRGYFVLDVTRPDNFSSDSPQNLAVLDNTHPANNNLKPVKPQCNNSQACLAEFDIGHIFNKALKENENSQSVTQIAQLNNDRWALVIGNGYNSPGQRPVLLIQYLDGNKELRRLVATGNIPTGFQPNTSDNGLSVPRLVDINGDKRPDVAYAGDLKGNLWKFLLTDNDDAKWGVAQWGSQAGTTNNHNTVGVPLFTASHMGQRQPITAAPNVRDGKQGLMVAFGTGRNLTNDDPANTDVQTLYSVLDNTHYKRADSRIGNTLRVKGRIEVCALVNDPACSIVKSNQDLPSPVQQSQLVQRQIVAIKNAQPNPDKRFWNLDSNNIAFDPKQHKGWYMNLPETGERLLKPLNFYDRSNILLMYSQAPIASGNAAAGNQIESCDFSQMQPERQFLTMINIFDGKAPSVPIIDSNGDNAYNALDADAIRMAVSAGSQTLVQVNDRKVNIGQGPNGNEVKDELATMPDFWFRPSWRQLQ